MIGTLMLIAIAFKLEAIEYEMAMFMTVCTGILSICRVLERPIGTKGGSHDPE